MTFSSKSRLSLMAVLVASGVMASAPAFAESWTADSEATWVARTHILAQVGGDGSQQYDISQLGANMAAACDGLQSEQMAHEYGKEPKWALTSQIYVCTAYERWSGKSFMTSKRPCHDIELAINALAEAKAGTDPDDVVAAAADLTATAQAILAATEGHKQSCVFR